MKSTNKDLPPPHWSPSGNSGYWKWREDEKGVECWRWFDDEQTPASTQNKKVLKKSWFKKLFNFFLTKK
jgi:hypothetical protein